MTKYKTPRCQLEQVFCTSLPVFSTKPNKQMISETQRENELIPACKTLSFFWPAQTTVFHRRSTELYVAHRLPHANLSPPSGIFQRKSSRVRSEEQNRVLWRSVQGKLAASEHPVLLLPLCWSGSSQSCGSAPHQLSQPTLENRVCQGIRQSWFISRT